MKIVSVYSFELPDCKSTQFRERPGNQYMMYFECGLVLSSWFLRRLPPFLRVNALMEHKNHHSFNHTLNLKMYCLGKYSIPGREVVVRCGSGCEYRPTFTWEMLLVEQSNIVKGASNITEPTSGNWPEAISTPDNKRKSPVRKRKMMLDG